MAPTIRVDDEVIEELKRHAVTLGLVFGSPNDVLRRILNVGEEAKEMNPDQGKTDVDYQVGVAEKSEKQGYVSPTGMLPKPLKSHNPDLQRLLDQLLPQLKDTSEQELEFEQARSGRWIARPENFVTIKPQERSRDLAFTISGYPNDFAHIATSFEIKPDMGSYSRFKIDKADQIWECVRIIRRAREIWQGRRRR
ncbi:hypothetical protein FIM08_03450 [SAR202 cluster bacterium AC-647-N09_OGT_505m]|nr:hypothetical protein [SAR202 cluster bacterium AC-647-N09_OGT_505m]